MILHIVYSYVHYSLLAEKYREKKDEYRRR